GQLAVQGNTTVRGALGVASSVTSGGNLTVQRDGTGAPQFQVIAGSGDTLISGKLAVGNDVAVNGDRFVVQASDGSTTIRGGALTVENSGGGPEFQVSPVSGLISVASKGGLDNLAPGELDIGTANANNI